jgi:hypothetical protein
MRLAIAAWDSSGFLNPIKITNQAIGSTNIRNHRPTFYRTFLNIKGLK